MVLPAIATAASRMASKKVGQIAASKVSNGFVSKLTGKAVEGVANEISKRSLTRVLDARGNQNAASFSDTEVNGKDNFGSVEANSNLSTETRITLGPSITRSLEGLPVKKEDMMLTGENEDEERGGGPAQNQDELSEEYERRENLRQEENIQTAAHSIQSEDSKKNAEISKFERVKDALLKEGLKLDDDEVRELIESNFKVRFPYLFIVIFFFQTVVGVFVPITSMTFTMAGAGIAAIPVVGTALGVAVSAFSTVLLVMSIVFNFVLSGLKVSYQIWYERNASSVMKKVGFARRWTYKKVAGRAVSFLVGSMPFLNVFTTVITTILVYRYCLKKTSKVRNILEEEGLI